MRTYVQASLWKQRSVCHARLALRTLISVCAVLFVADRAASEVIIDDFTQGNSFTTVYSTGFFDHPTGLDPAHVLGGARSALFPTISPSARAALDTTAGSLSLDNIHGDAGGAGLSLRYGNQAIGGTALHFDFTAYADARLEVDFLSLVAGDTKGVQPGITWNTNIVSLDNSAEEFTNVPIFVPNNANPFQVSLPVSALFGGAANASDVLGLTFNFFPLGDGGQIAISRIAIVPEPATIVLAAMAVLGSVIGAIRKGFRKKAAASLLRA